jgi:hypothetical protein
MDRATDRKTGIVLILVSLIWLWASISSIEIPAGSADGPNSQTFPLLFGGLLGVCGLLLFIQASIDVKHDGSESEQKVMSGQEVQTQWQCVVLMAGSLALYSLLMNWIGFFASTVAIILLVLTCALKIFNRKLLLAIPIGIAIGVYLVFGQLLGVHLPVGQLINFGI